MAKKGSSGNILLGCLFLAAAAILGGPIVRYFSNQDAPSVFVHEMEHNPCLRGEVCCMLEASSVCSLKDLKVFIDSNPIEFDAKKLLGKKTGQIPFSFDSKKIDDGLHTLEVEAVDGGWNVPTKRKSWFFSVDNIDLSARLVQNEFSLMQGRTIHLKLDSNKPILSAEATFRSKKYKCSACVSDPTMYDFFIPTECDLNPGNYSLDVNISDHAGNHASLMGSVEILDGEFKKQKGFSVAREKLATEKELSSNDLSLEEILESWLPTASQEKSWKGNFEIPTVVQRYSTPFGEIRVTPEKGRYMHRAVDIANAPKSVVWASQDGTVLVKERFLMSGNTVVVDHGMGIVTMYSHLDDFAEIKVGQVVKKGNPVGTIGKTGYANGYHLHWELRVAGVAVDPLQWTEKTF